MSEQPQPTPSVTENEVQTEPTLFEKVIAGTERIAKDATQYVAGLTEGDTPPEGTTVTEHDLRMRKAGKELAGEFNKAAVQGVVYVAGCADAVSKSLHAQYTEPAASEEKKDRASAALRRSFPRARTRTALVPHASAQKDRASAELRQSFPRARTRTALVPHASAQKDRA
eukprot:gene26700-30172_t